MTDGDVQRDDDGTTRVLIAEDDPVSRRLLEATLSRWGYDVCATGDGAEAWAVLQRPDAPALAVLDWMMPEIDGVELCRRVRAAGGEAPRYLILLTAKGRREDLVEGLEAGADDYITKPFDRKELRARLKVGVRILTLQRNLADRLHELQVALSRVRLLQGLLPICAYCKKIRDDGHYWREVEAYITQHSEAQFSHGICPDCYERVVIPKLAELREHQRAGKEAS